MSENEENVNEETPEEAAEEAVPEAEAAPEEAPAEEPAAEEPAAEEEPPAEEAPPAEEPAAEPAEPEERLSPKELRRRARSTHTGEAAPARTIEERAQARAEERKRKATHRRAYRLKQREKRAGQPRSEPPAHEPKATAASKLRQGIVVSDKADKTITVRIDSARPHRMYKKIVRTTSTLHAHDENNDAHIGDTVRLVESRPLSRTKRWRLVEVLERAR
jgi:small subunit ribosomal protein S17